MKVLDVNTLRELISYDPDSGLMHWKFRDVRWFNDNGCYPALASARRWNTIYATTPAMTTKDKAGYMYGSIFDVKYRTHRVAWAIHYGNWPPYQIDHINGVKHDNRIHNLRSATNCQNLQNRGKLLNNTSGYKGVTLHKKSNRWRALISFNGRQIHLGSYGTREEAYREYCAASDRLHGEFSKY